MSNKLAAWQLFSNLYRIGIVSLLSYLERSFIKSMFQLVSVTASTCRKEARNKKNSFHWVESRFLPVVFPKKVCFH